MDVQRGIAKQNKKRKEVLVGGGSGSWDCCEYGKCKWTRDEIDCSHASMTIFVLIVAGTDIVRWVHLRRDIDCLEIGQRGWWYKGCEKRNDFREVRSEEAMITPVGMEAVKHEFLDATTFSVRPIFTIDERTIDSVILSHVILEVCVIETVEIARSVVGGCNWRVADAQTRIGLAIGSIVFVHLHHFGRFTGPRIHCNLVAHS
jgi:hypothetical protein